MKPKKARVVRRTVWPRILGYGGATVLVVAAFVVLLIPLLGSGETGSGQASGQAAGGPQATPQGGLQQPGNPAPSGQVTNPAPQQNPGSQPYPQGGNGQGGQGDPVPGPGGSGAGNPCPTGLGAAQQVAGALRVTVQVSGTAIVQVEVHLRGLDSRKRNGKVAGGKPKTFEFKNTSAAQVERIQIKTFGTMVPQSCDLQTA